MREKIAMELRIWKEQNWESLGYYEEADAMLEAISEEIEKVELAEYKKSWTSDGEKFTDCLIPVTPEDTRQTILSLLRPIKNPVGSADL